MDDMVCFVMHVVIASSFKHNDEIRRVLLALILKLP
jgi:hypothetical protein